MTTYGIHGWSRLKIEFYRLQVFSYFKCLSSAPVRLARLIQGTPGAEEILGWPTLLSGTRTHHIFQRWNMSICWTSTTSVPQSCWSRSAATYSCWMSNAFSPDIYGINWYQLASMASASASAATLQCDLTQCDLTCPASLNFARWALIAMSRCAAVIMMGLLCVAYCLTCHASAQRHSQLSNLYFGHWRMFPIQKVKLYRMNWSELIHVAIPVLQKPLHCKVPRKCVCVTRDRCDAAALQRQCRCDMSSASPLLFYWGTRHSKSCCDDMMGINHLPH